MPYPISRRPAVRPSLRLLFAASALALAALSPAPINDQRARQPIRPEQSQSQLAKEQAFNGARPVVGQVQVDERRHENVEESSQPGAADAVSAASRAADPSAVIAEASARVEGKSARRGLPWWLLATFVGAVAFGILKGFRLWADKALPAPGHLR